MNSDGLRAQTVCEQANVHKLKVIKSKCLWTSGFRTVRVVWRVRFVCLQNASFKMILPECPKKIDCRHYILLERWLDSEPHPQIAMQTGDTSRLAEFNPAVNAPTSVCQVQRWSRVDTVNRGTAGGYKLLSTSMFLLENFLAFPYLFAYLSFYLLGISNSDYKFHDSQRIPNDHATACKDSCNEQCLNIFSEETLFPTKEAHHPKLKANNLLHSGFN